MHQPEISNQEVYDAAKQGATIEVQVKDQPPIPIARQVGHYLIALLAFSFAISSCQSYQHPDLEIRQLGFQLTPEQDAYLDTANAFAVLRTVRGTKHKLDSLLTWTDMLKDHDEERALIYANEAYRLGTEKGFRLSRAIAMYYRALLKGRGGILGEGVVDALADAKISERLLKNRDDLYWRAQIRGVLGDFYFRNRRSDSSYSKLAINLELEALSLLKSDSSGSDEQIYQQIQILVDLANVHSEIDSVKSISLYEESLAKAETLQNKALLAGIWRVIGIFYQKKYKFNQANLALQKALEYGLEGNDSKELIEIYQRLGNLYGVQYYDSKMEDDFEKAILFSRKALELQSTSKLHAENIYFTYELLGYSYHDKFSFRPNEEIYTSEADSALKYYYLAIEEARKEGVAKGIKILVEYVSDLCDKREELTDRKCTELSNYNNYDYEFINENYQALFDTLRLEQQLANARLRKSEREGDLAVSNRRAVRIWSISGISLLFTAFVFVLVLQRQQQRRLKARLAALRAQINPHFMSNSLNAIENLVNRNENEAASKYLIHFSRLSRKILSSSVDSTTSLAEELRTLQHFLALEELRFKDKLTYQIQVEANLDPKKIKIPSLILQPYVENAILHGIKPKNGPSLLLIKAGKQGKELVCTIVDDGVGRRKAQELKDKSVLVKHQSQGMKITEERLEKIGKVKGSKVEVVDLYDAVGAPAGTRVIIRLPYREIK